MKLPRWLIGSLIVTSAVTLISLAAWWWFTWPTRTIEEFTTLIEQGRLDEANRMLKSPGRWVLENIDGGDRARFDDGGTAQSKPFPLSLWQNWCSRANLQTEHRSFADLVRSRQPFSFHNQLTTPFFIGGSAERGTITIRCEPWAAVP
jgi:hypothetical protein